MNRILLSVAKMVFEVFETVVEINELKSFTGIFYIF